MLSNPRNHDEVLDGKYFSGEFRVDTNYMYDYNHPIDHTLDETTEGERTGEFVIQALGVGGDFHAGNMQGRILTQFGAVSTAVPRNDASYSQGQWDLADAYRYLTEMYAGYHINVQHGLNIQVGDFLSFIGLFSYYSFDNWMYQPSYVSSNTPWFFTGMRAQLFPTNKLKIEPWLINGWQTYAKYNGREGRRRPDSVAAHRESATLCGTPIRWDATLWVIHTARAITQTGARSGNTTRIPASSCTGWR